MCNRLFIGLLFLAFARCDILLPAYVGSGMVLEHGTANKLWGLDAPGATVTVSYAGQRLTSPADASGRWQVTLPPQPMSAVPSNISISSTSGAAPVALSDVLHGNTFLCSGQSNMQISVIDTVDWAGVVAGLSAVGPVLRLLQVREDPANANATSPQANLTVSIPWARANEGSAPQFSATCFYFGLRAVLANSSRPIGLIDSSWGGSAIQPWMSPDALAKCPNAARFARTPEELVHMGTRHGASHEERALAALGSALRRDSAIPNAPSCLYFSMIAPLLANAKSGILWYQGESNADDPIGYQCQQPAMFADWRASLAAAGADPTLPILFVQLAAWPVADQPFLPIFRVAVESTLSALPRVGMAVAADISDPAGAIHPIHPPWKAELGRRAFLFFDNALWGNATSPTSGPRVVSAVWDSWSPSWGDFHYGYGTGSYACAQPGPWFCGGIRVTFDQPIFVRDFYAPVNAAATGASIPTLRAYSFLTGAASGFEAWNTANLSDVSAWMQHVVLTGIRTDGATAQLNVTWIDPSRAAPPLLLTYSWHDYPPAMPLVNADGLPVGPFNVTITAALA